LQNPDDQFQAAKDFFDKEQWQDAAIMCNKVLAQVEHPLVINLLGMSLMKLGKRDFAERVLYEGLELDP